LTPTSTLNGGSPAFRLIYTGLLQCRARPGESCRAQISDVDWAKGRITLAEHKTARKTRKPRVIPIGKNFGQTLQKAIDRRQIGPVFLSPKSEPWSVGNLSGTHRRLRDAAGLPRDLVLYLARHRFGTEALRAGLPLKDVADPMGHASVTTTEI
jgi:integrase